MRSTSTSSIGDRSASPAVFGVSPNWLALRGEDVADGVFFSNDQNTSLARVAVIGTDVQRDLFPGEDPVGKSMRVADVPFQVIGVLKSRGAGPAGASLDNIILIPVNTASRRLSTAISWTMLVAQVKNGAEHGKRGGRDQPAAAKRHHIRPPALDDFTSPVPRPPWPR